MALTMRMEEGHYSYQEPITQLTEEVIRQSREKFERFRELGIIHAKRYEDSSWIITDEVRKNITLDFAIDELAYAKYAREKLGCDAATFSEAMRVTITSVLGRSVYALQQLVRAIRYYVGRDRLDARKIVEITMNGPGIADLLLLLPGDSTEKLRLIDEIQDQIEAAAGEKRGGKRTLAYYQSYFRFEDFMTDFWEKAEEQQKLLFFPIYLWWRITMIIPLRPTEFVLTPRDCIVTDSDGMPCIKLRRSKRKGTVQAVCYKIAEDYTIQDYRIPTKLAETVLWYRKATENVYVSDIDTLFCKHTQFKLTSMNRDNDNHYTYANLVQCLSYYYRDVLAGLYGLSVVGCKEKPLQEGEIGEISLGDTRHIALINLVMSGASLQTCKELAGHQHIITADHYYSNIKSFLDVLALEQQYRVSIVNIPDNTTQLHVVENGIPVNNGEGLCFSVGVANGDFSDCSCVCDQYGYPGTCDNCRYYLPSSAARGREICKHAEEQLKYTCVLLEKALNQYRKGIGKEESIRSAIDKLQTDALVCGEKQMMMARKGYYGKEKE